MRKLPPPPRHARDSADYSNIRRTIVVLGAVVAIGFALVGMRFDGAIHVSVLCTAIVVLVVYALDVRARRERRALEMWNEVDAEIVSVTASAGLAITAKPGLFARLRFEVDGAPHEVRQFIGPSIDLENTPTLRILVDPKNPRGSIQARNIRWAELDPSYAAAMSAVSAPPQLPAEREVRP